MTRQGSHTCASRSLSNRTYIIGIPQAAWTQTRHFTLSHAIAAGQRRCAPAVNFGVMPVDKSVPASST